MTITNPKRVRESFDFPPESDPEIPPDTRIAEYERQLASLKEQLSISQKERQVAELHAKALEQELEKVKQQSKLEIEEFFEVQSKLMDEIEGLYQENHSLRNGNELRMFSKVKVLGDRIAKRMALS